jgi:hypothetical protein
MRDTDGNRWVVGKKAVVALGHSLLKPGIGQHSTLAVLLHLFIHEAVFSLSCLKQTRQCSLL